MRSWIRVRKGEGPDKFVSQEVPNPPKQPCLGLCSATSSYQKAWHIEPQIIVMLVVYCLWWRLQYSSRNISTLSLWVVLCAVGSTDTFSICMHRNATTCFELRKTPISITGVMQYKRLFTNKQWGCCLNFIAKSYVSMFVSELPKHASFIVLWCNICTNAMNYDMLSQCCCNIAINVITIIIHH